MKKPSRTLALCILFLAIFSIIYYTKANDRMSIIPQDNTNEKQQLIAEYNRIDELVEGLKNQENISEADIDNLLSRIQKCSLVEKADKKDNQKEISVKFKNGGIISWRVLE